MSNIIDKIQLSGVTYTIGGGGGGTGGTAVEEMTQAQYDAAATAGTLDDETLYIITDAEEINANEYVTKAQNTVSATTIFVDYEGNFTNQNNGENIVRSVTFNYIGDKSSTTNQNAYFSIVDTNTWTWYSANAYFNYTNGTYTKDDSNNILDVTYDSSIEDFKVTISANYPNCSMSNVQFYGGYIRVPFSTIASGQSANVIQTSIANIFGDVYSKNLNNITNCYFSIYSSSNKNLILSYSNGRNSGIEGGRLYLEDLKAENRNGYNYLSSDINIPLGTSGWTAIDIGDMSICSTDKPGEIGATVYRITYSYDEQNIDYSNLTTSFEIHLKKLGSQWYNDSQYIIFVESGSTYVPSVAGSIFDGLEPTLEWDGTTKKLTVSYPATYTHPNDIYGFGTYDVVVNSIRSSACRMGSQDLLSGIEYYAEQIQSLKPYVQQLRTDVNTISGQVDTKISTSAVTTAVTSGSTDAEIPTAKAVYDALGGGGGSITIDPSLDSGSTNPVANSAITDTIYNQTARFVGNASYGYGVNISFNEGTGNYMGISLAKLKTTANGISQTSSGDWCRISTINGKKVFSINAANVSDFSLVETSAITTAITSSSTDAQVPSAKAVYDIVGNIETLLSQI